MTSFKLSMFSRPSVFNQSQAAVSPASTKGFTPFFHVARPHKTPLNVEPASLAKRSVSWNSSVETPALKKMNGKSVA